MHRTSTQQRRPANRGAGRARDARGPGGHGSRAPRRTTPHAWFAERLAAVLGGLHPVHLMIGQVTDAAYEELLALTSASPFAPGCRPALRSCRGVPLRPGVVEGCASLEAEGRVHAMAFRIEQGRDHRWRCTALELAASRGHQESTA